MANFNYKRGYSVEELEVLLARAKVEREEYLSSASDSGSSYSRIALNDVERKINGILDALEYLCPTRYKAIPKVIISGVRGGVIQ